MKKEWKAPTPIEFEITDREGDNPEPIGTASITFGTDTVSVKARANGFIAKEPVLDEKGQPVTNQDGTIRQQAIRVPVPVRTTNVKLMLPGIGEITARSCCKRPDPFDEKAGIELAARRVIKDNRVPKEMHKSVLRALCPWVLAGKSKVKSVKDVKAITPSKS